MFWTDLLSMRTVDTHATACFVKHMPHCLTFGGGGLNVGKCKMYIVHTGTCICGMRSSRVAEWIKSSCGRGLDLVE
jgi:hypothetical protein